MLSQQIWVSSFGKWGSSEFVHLLIIIIRERCLNKTLKLKSRLTMESCDFCLLAQSLISRRRFRFSYHWNSILITFHFYLSVCGCQVVGQEQKRDFLARHCAFEQSIKHEICATLQSEWREASREEEGKISIFMMRAMSLHKIMRKREEKTKTLSWCWGEKRWAATSGK